MFIVSEITGDHSYCRNGFAALADAGVEIYSEIAAFDASNIFGLVNNTLLSLTEVAEATIKCLNEASVKQLDSEAAVEQLDSEAVFGKGHLIFFAASNAYQFGF